MTIAKVTPATAPRDHAQLIRLGRFQLRQLAQDVGLMSDEDRKSSFTAHTVDQQAQDVLTALIALDRGATISPAPVAAAAAPVETPPAPPAEKAPSKRTPRNSGGAPAAEVPAQPAAATMVDLSPVVALLDELKSKSLGNDVTIASRLDTTIATLNAISAKVDGLQNILAANLTLGLMLAEQVLGGGRDEVLGVVLEDMKDVLAKVAGGKAKK